MFTVTLQCTIPFSTELNLAALLDIPPAQERLPLVILLHGFTGWKEEEHLSSLAIALNKRGIGVLRFDAPGSGESDGTFADDYRLSNYIASVKSVLDWINEDSRIDEDRLAIWGHSMGGYVAMASAAKFPNTFRAVCGSQPSMGKSDENAELLNSWKQTGWATFTNERFPEIMLPFSYYLDRQSHDALVVASNVAAPLLLISGARDDLVTSKSVCAIYDAAPEPKTYVEYAVDHFYKRDPEALEKINETTVEFFANSLL